VQTMHWLTPMKIYKREKEDSFLKYTDAS